MSWYMWWIQNSYGPTYCSLPFLSEPWITALQNAQDLWFKFEGDGKRVGSFPPEPAPDGSLCDCAGPTSVIYKQGDMDTSLHKRHDWFYEGAAAGVVMQAELLLIGRDTDAIRRYLPKLERSCDFIERRRDARNNLFLVGPASNLLAPSYGGQPMPNGTYGRAYLAGLSINYLAALDRMIELEKMAGDAGKVAVYEHRRKITRDSLPTLLTDDAYFVKFVETGGIKHGVLGQKQFGYFEVAPNVDAVCFRAVDDALAGKIVSRITSIPELRPCDMLITNYPSLDDIYLDGGSKSAASMAVDKLMEYGKWVNGGVWTTMEARAIMAYARTGHYDDIARSMKASFGLAQGFKLDAPLGFFGKSGWNPAQHRALLRCPWPVRGGCQRAVRIRLQGGQPGAVSPHSRERHAVLPEGADPVWQQAHRDRRYQRRPQRDCAIHQRQESPRRRSRSRRPALRRSARACER